MELQFSYSKLGAFKDCPRCFWMAQHKGIKTPRGKAGSLPQGMDAHLKRRYDHFRASDEGKPPELKHKTFFVDNVAYYLSGGLFKDQAKLKQWRYWKTGLQAEIDGVRIIGALDDAWDFEDGKISMLDYKTRASAPADGYAEKYYGRQVDFYDLLFRENGIEPGDDGIFVFYYPHKTASIELHLHEAPETYGPKCRMVASDMGSPIGLPFDITIQIVKPDPERVVKLIKDAATCLRGTMPESGPECEYCAFITERSNYK